MKVFQELNNDQLDGLAKLCFDLAKGSFALAILPSTSIPQDPVVGFVKVLMGLMWGFAFTYIALVLLKYKKGILR